MIGSHQNNMVDMNSPLNLESMRKFPDTCDCVYLGPSYEHGDTLAHGIFVKTVMSGL